MSAAQFDRAIYPGGSSSLPYYSERIPWNEIQNSKPEVFFTNLQFEPVNTSDPEWKNIRLNNLTDAIVIRTGVQIERKRAFAVFSFIPFRKNPSTGQIERLVSFIPEIKRVDRPVTELKTKANSRTYASQSVLANGRWYKIQVNTRGIQKLTYADLKKMGIQNPDNVRIYGNGGFQLPYDSSIDRPDDLVENPVYFDKGADGQFGDSDFVIFYASGTTTWKYDASKKIFNHKIHLYSDYSNYFITEDLGPGKRVTGLNASTLLPQTTVTTYNAIDYREQDSLNLIKSGRQWCWKHFSIQLRRGFSFNFPHRIISEPVKVTTSLWGRSSSTSQASKFYLLNEETLFETVELAGVHTDNYEALYASTAISNSSFTPASESVTINFQFVPSNPAAEGWLDYLTLNTRCNLIFDGGQLSFRDAQETGNGKVVRFQIGQAKVNNLVWEVTDANEIRQQAVQAYTGGIEFVAAADKIREYIVFDPGSAALPVPAYSGDGLGLIANQNLHGLECPDMIILVHDDLKTYALQLADFHKKHDGLTTLLVSPVQIYNEFSSGMTDVTAIRDFLKMFYDRSSAETFRLKYFLFFGDGSYDNKNTVKDFRTCLPTYQSLESLYPTSSYVTDDFFGLLDTGEDIEAGLLEIGIGRFPVLSESEATAMIEKINQYYSPSALGDWRNLVCFIGDDEDGNTHMRDANTLADLLKVNNPVFNIDKIFLDAYQQVTLPTGDRYPEVNRAIGDRMKKGALIMNYLGHGSERGLAHEEILTISDIKNWKNPERLPLFITATCEFSRFDDPSLVSAGEWVILNPGGGGIALFSTTRLVYSSPNFILNRELYNYAFSRDALGKRLTLGDVMRLTKNAVGEEQNKLNFTLLGDPALTLCYPEYGITMTQMNGKPVGEFIDTLKALTAANISGFVNDLNGNKLTDFSGMVLPTIFDKEVTLTNLANDGGPIMEFDVRNSILFRGKASVKNGEFTFNFIVPKDISYKIGTGKLSFYGNNNLTDAAGVNLRVLIGGSSTSGIADKNGPELGIFMNDTTFVSGGITNENPILLAKIKDASGVNTTSNGIGHDITAILDGNLKNPIMLNDYYESDLDQYRSGSLKYPISKLEPGDHTIRVKVWDILNNSSESEITFTVKSSQDLVIDHVLNYPNPFTTHTDFYFEHNQGQQSLDVLLQIYTVSGKLVKSFEFLSADQTQINPGSFRVGPIPWDGLDDFGDRIGRGTYFYRVKVRTSDGKSKEAFQKLVILK
ncbi:MAG: type IX secretion system sortase PorU [Bacteroidia bacterium]|nr:type IX secretion system sortase PorU [Bacteroidia bacterium]